jgi:amino acid transporter
VKEGVAGLKQYDLKVSTIVFMIYCLVAAGAFGIEEMIPSSGPGLTIVMLVLFAVFWALPISHMVAELGSILPAEGGSYVWVKEALGEFWGFQAGWWATMSIYVTNGVYVALVVGYLSRFFDFSETEGFLIKIAMILIFTVINLMGIREVGRVSTVLSIIVLLAFSAVALVGFTNWQGNPFVPFMPEGQGLIESVGGGIAICIWMYCGYECISSVAGEIKDPQVIPKGLLIAMPLIAASYILPTMAGLASVGRWEEWATDGVDAVGYMDVFTSFLGPAFGIVFMIIAIISQCSIFNTYLASGSRGFFVLADDHLSPRILVKVSAKKGVPYVGILSLTLVTIFLAQFDFTLLVMGEVVFMIALYIILSISTIVLRKKIPLEKRVGKYSIPGGTIGLYLCCGLPFSISIIALLINGTEYFLIGLIAISTGPVLYVIVKRRYGGLHVLSPESHPINPITKLAAGDVIRISFYCVLTGLFAIAGSFFLLWYEGDWGQEYYLEEYEEGLISSFETMIAVLQYGGAVLMLVGLICYIIGKRIDKPSTVLSLQESA